MPARENKTGRSTIVSDTAILPAHIEDTLRAIAKLHADHRDEAGPLQRAVDRATAWIGRPRFMAGMTALVALWIVGNALAHMFTASAWDPPPFGWLQGSVSLMALYVTLFILTTQRRDDELAGHREQLTLELAIIGEQKSAKIIALLEEMRRDSPYLHDRLDVEASVMAVAADPQAVLDAIKESEAIAAAGGSLPPSEQPPPATGGVRAARAGKARA